MCHDAYVCLDDVCLMTLGGHIIMGVSDDVCVMTVIMCHDSYVWHNSRRTRHESD